MPDIATPPHHPLHRCGRCVDGRSDIEVEDRFARWLGITGVVVDYVADLFCVASWGAAGYVPVVAIKGRLAADERSWVSKGARPRGDGTYPNLVGQTHPSACSIPAFGVISFGLP